MLRENKLLAINFKRLKSRLKIKLSTIVEIAIIFIACAIPFATWIFPIFSLTELGEVFVVSILLVLYSAILFYNAFKTEAKKE